MNKDVENLKFEEALSRLEQVVKALEDGELTLEESIEKFQYGVSLSKYIDKQLKEAEQKISILTKDQETGELKEEPFEIEEE